MLRRKEIADRQAYQQAVDKHGQMRVNKLVVKKQMQDREDLAMEAKEQYQQER